MPTNRCSRPIGRLSHCAANGARSPLTTITFLGEQQDITDLPRERREALRYQVNPEEDEQHSYHRGVVHSEPTLQRVEVGLRSFATEEVVDDRASDRDAPQNDEDDKRDDCVTYRESAQ